MKKDNLLDILVNKVQRAIRFSEELTLTKKQKQAAIQQLVQALNTAPVIHIANTNHIAWVLGFAKVTFTFIEPPTKQTVAHAITFAEYLGNKNEVKVVYNRKLDEVVLPVVLSHELYHAFIKFRGEAIFFDKLSATAPIQFLEQNPFLFSLVYPPNDLILAKQLQQAIAEGVKNFASRAKNVCKNLLQKMPLLPIKEYDVVLPAETAKDLQGFLTQDGFWEVTLKGVTIYVTHISAGEGLNSWTIDYVKFPPTDKVKNFLYSIEEMPRYNMLRAFNHPQSQPRWQLMSSILNIPVEQLKIAVTDTEADVWVMQYGEPFVKCFFPRLLAFHQQLNQQYLNQSSVVIAEGCQQNPTHPACFSSLGLNFFNTGTLFSLRNSSLQQSALNDALLISFSTSKLSRKVLSLPALPQPCALIAAANYVKLMLNVAVSAASTQATLSLLQEMMANKLSVISNGRIGRRGVKSIAQIILLSVSTLMNPSILFIVLLELLLTMAITKIVGHNASEMLLVNMISAFGMAWLALSPEKMFSAHHVALTFTHVLTTIFVNRLLNDKAGQNGQSMTNSTVLNKRIDVLRQEKVSLNVAGHFNPKSVRSSIRYTSSRSTMARLITV